MTESSSPIFFSFVCGATLWLALLRVGAQLNPGRRGRIVEGAFGLATMLTLFVPIGGLPIWSWAFTFCPNPSLPMLGMICSALWQHLSGVPVLKPADWRATWIFGAIAGTVLYLHPILLPALDLYYWGWDRTMAAWCLAALAVLCLAWGNRLGVLLLAALIAFQLETLESQNCWDYVIDPFYWIISLGFNGTQLFLRCIGSRAMRERKLV
jgi:hypothetical protein